MRTLSIALVALAATSLSAQTMTIPNGFDAKEGGSNHWVPGRYNRSIGQSIFHNSVIDGIGSVAITKLSLRPNGTSTSYVANDRVMQIFLSSVGVKDPDFVSKTSFKANHGTDATEVFTAKKVSFPKPGTNTPRAWVMFTLDKPFPYVKGNNLLIQYVSTPLNNDTTYSYNYYQDAENLGSSGGNGSYSYILSNNGCTTYSTSGYMRTYPSPTADARPGKNMRIYMYGAPLTTKTGVNWLGARKTSPIDLSVIGMKNCFWAVDIVASQVIVLGNPSSTYNRGEAFWKIPAQSSLAGAKVSTQWAAASKNQALGLAMSQATEITLGTLAAPLGGFHLYSYQSSASDTPVNDTPEFNVTYPPIVKVN